MRKKLKSKAQIPNGARVQVVNTGGRPYLEHTVGQYGKMHIGRDSVHIVHFDNGGQHTYPLSALQKVPKP